MGEGDMSTNERDYFDCPKCGMHTEQRPAGITCPICGPIAPMIRKAQPVAASAPAPKDEPKPEPKPQAAQQFAGLHQHKRK